MIKNIPELEEFENISKQCFVQAFNLLYREWERYKSYDQTVKDEITLDSIWEHNEGTIRTSLILLYQGIESKMKSEICLISPLFLLDSNRADWKTLPNSPDVEFNNLATISGDALIKTYCALDLEKPLKDEFINYIEKIERIEINQCMVLETIQLL